MDMNQPPAIYWTTDANGLTIKQPKPVVTITAAGQVMRGDAPLESLSKEQLIVVVNELIDLIRRR
jgi:hypothetical protein